VDELLGGRRLGVGWNGGGDFVIAFEVGLIDDFGA
jgi:hypothetical protein